MAPAKKETVKEEAPVEAPVEKVKEAATPALSIEAAQAIGAAVAQGITATQPKKASLRTLQETQALIIKNGNSKLITVDVAIEELEKGFLADYVSTQRGMKMWDKKVIKGQFKIIVLRMKGGKALQIFIEDGFGLPKLREAVGKNFAKAGLSVESVEAAAIANSKIGLYNGRQIFGVTGAEDQKVRDMFGAKEG